MKKLYFFYCIILIDYKILNLNLITVIFTNISDFFKREYKNQIVRLLILFYL